MRKLVLHLLQLAAVQGLAQLFLLAMGSTAEEASLTVCLGSVLAPLYFPKVNVFYRKTFSLLPR